MRAALFVVAMVAMVGLLGGTAWADGGTYSIQAQLAAQAVGHGPGYGGHGYGPRPGYGYGHGGHYGHHGPSGYWGGCWAPRPVVVVPAPVVVPPPVYYRDYGPHGSFNYNTGRWGIHLGF